MSDKPLPAHGEANAPDAPLRAFRLSRERLQQLANHIAALPAARLALFGLVSSGDGATGGAEDEPGSGGASLPTVADVCRELADALARDVFRVAVIGEYSTGKSSLMNVLLRQIRPGGRKTDGLLPTSILPTTAVVTTLYHRREPHIEVTLDDGARFAADPDELAAYLSQPDLWSKFSFKRDAARKEQMAARLREVRVGLNAPLLADGIEFVDTPGLGSVHRDHERITRRQVAQVDGALFLVSVDPPMGEREMTFLQYVAGFTDRFVFVQTKRDMGEGQEKGEPIFSRVERANRRRIREVLGRDDFPFFHISALQAAAGLRRNDEKELAASGVPALERALERFLVELRGAPRLAAWVGRCRRALDLLDLHLRAEADALDARLRQIEASRMTRQDEAQWEGMRDIFEDNAREREKTMKERVSESASVVKQSVKEKSRLLLAQLDAQTAHRDPDAVPRFEREILRELQSAVRKETQPIAEEVVAETTRAASQALGPDLPETLRRFLSIDPAGDVLKSLDLRLRTDDLVSVSTSEKNRAAHGFWDGVAQAVKGLFDAADKETITTYTLNRDYFDTFVAVAVQDALDEVRHGLDRQLRDLRRTIVGELDRIHETARRANAETDHLAAQSHAECQVRVSTLRDEQNALARCRVELDEIAALANAGFAGVAAAGVTHAA